ncbi:FAD-dependent oxidoreductase [Aliiglaciecola sp. 2_MG-2023]|uniref:FAD-dependent oxidoreductase n=1 Tax=unclassified Aliiglaciecola TaxID=2593648 RepID=UPI0026E41139|nr:MULTISPECIES: FAD-dependent oxidoreductase [unclassified Aliiglaciecola]MDO6710699.1 FAD-dependent oxidoreductase [Aliiglaciecola sp. 2_MG-2023]MDO6751893.1 FAD-dependent oxidoreductase [Aliiglaciecola sp. 1_MG-2023]
MKNLDIAVVGAGIAGLTAAIALAKNGQKVSLYESAPAWGDVGAGITLAPNAMRGLDYIGVGEAIVEAGIEPSTQKISHWQSGETLLMVDRSQTREQYSSAYVYIHRADLHRILVAEAEKAGVGIYLGKLLRSVNYQAAKPVLIFADDSTADADLIIGADGLKSQVRQLFNSVQPHFTGHIAYRALAPITPAIQHLIEQPGMHIGPGKMVVRYPLRKGKLLNLVFFARQDGWTEDGWSIPAELQELKDLYAGWSDDISTLIDAIKPGTVFKWAINAHSSLPHWSIDNKVTLIGDAAHAMTPFLGQGAATGIEDAVMLARVLEDAESVAKALARYQAARHERTTFIQKESNENADRLQGEAAELYGLGNLRNEETLGLFNYDCVTESV